MLLLKKMKSTHALKTFLLCLKITNMLKYVNKLLRYFRDFIPSWGI